MNRHSQPLDEQSAYDMSNEGLDTAELVHSGSYVKRLNPKGSSVTTRNRLIIVNHTY